MCLTNDPDARPVWLSLDVKMQIVNWHNELRSLVDPLPPTCRNWWVFVVVVVVPLKDGANNDEARTRTRRIVSVLFVVVTRTT